MRKIVAVLALSAIALAACGGSSKKSGSGSSSSSDSFSQLYDKRKNATLKVTYSSTDSNGGSSSEFTVAQDGPDKMSFLSDNSEIIVNGTTATQCSDLDTTPTCTDYPGGVAAARAAIAAATAVLTVADSAISAAANAHDFGKTSTETIAGREAECVTLSLGGNIGGAIANKLGGDVSWESCIDKETGVVLKWSAQAGGNAGSIEATKVEQPSASDFEPPTTSQTTEPGATDTTGGGGSGETTTTACTPITLGGNITVPGVTLPCAPA